MNELLLELLAFLGLAVPVGAVLGVLWYGWRATRDKQLGLLPPSRRRAVPWSIIDIGFVLFLSFLFIPGLTHELLVNSGVLHWYYGSDFPAQLRLNANDSIQQLARARYILWNDVLSFPWKVGFILVLLHIGSGTQPYQLGLTGHRLVPNLVVGYLVWLGLAPLVLGLNYLVEAMYSVWRTGPPDVHPIFRLLDGQPGLFEWGLVVLSAVLVAPVFEELLFRGVLQGWMAQRSWGGDSAVTGAFALALFSRFHLIEKAVELGGTREGLALALEGFAPALFVLAMIPGYILVEALTWRWLPFSNAGRAVYGSALLFAACHSAVWPSPVALFPLGLGLGFLAFRTQSLVGPILVHALFNAISCLVLLVAPSQALKGNDTTSASPPSVPTASRVPGASWPRRTYASAIGPSRGDTTAEVTCPTSLPSRSSWVLLLSASPTVCGAVPRPASGAAISSVIFSPRSARLTWPRSRARTIGSWPRKQPFL